MNEIFDAHMHFKLDASNPRQDLCDKMAQSGITKAMLILNRAEEKQLFKQNFSFFQQHSDQFRIAATLNVRDDSPLAFFESLTQTGISLFAKLHPRITDIQRANFPLICEYLPLLQCRTVIIDCFNYGHHLENHIGMELGIELAQRFPKINFVLAHAGGSRLLECMLCTRTLPNIFYDISLSCCYLYGASIHADMVQLLKFNSSRTLFGSDYPDFVPAKAIENGLALANEAGLNDIQKAALFRENAERLYPAAG